MAKKNSFLPFTLILLLSIIMAGCVPLQTVPDQTSQFVSPTGDGKNDSDTYPDNAIDSKIACRPGSAQDGDAADRVREEWTAAEPESTLDQEAKALANLGRWEEGEPLSSLDGLAGNCDFPVTMNRQVAYYIEFFQNNQRASFSRWLSQAAPYISTVRERLAAAGLPKDLAYLPMVESGYNLTAYSSKQAAGPWQFISSTATRFGLRIDNYVDERRDIVKSTEAAIGYLSDLYDDLGSWPLVIAGYNAGGKAIKEAVNKAGTENFWDIAGTPHIPMETKLIVPKLIAVIIIANNVEKYGFTTPAAPEARYEVVEVPNYTHLMAVASACGVSVDTLAGLNRELRQLVTPPDRDYAIKVPAGKAQLVADNLSKVKSDSKISFITYVVKKGETLNTLCERYNLSTLALLKVNDLRKSKLQPGQEIRIPQTTTTYTLTAEVQPGTGKNGAKVMTAGKGTRRGAPRVIVADKTKVKPASQVASTQAGSGVYVVQGGESLNVIAQKHHLSTRDILRWNNLKEGKDLYPGQRLVLRADL